MRLITVQPRVVYEKIVNTGRYVAIPELSGHVGGEVGKPFREKAQTAYRWLMARMAERIGPPPAFVRSPVWAWHSLSRFRLRELEGADHLLRITLDIPDGDVVLTDTGLWSDALNGWYIMNDGNDEAEYDWFNELPKERQREITIRSWNKVFALGKASLIQATFWYLRREQIVDVRCLKPVTRRTYY